MATMTDTLAMPSDDAAGPPAKRQRRANQQYENFELSASQNNTLEATRSDDFKNEPPRSVPRPAVKQPAMPRPLQPSPRPAAVAVTPPVVETASVPAQEAPAAPPAAPKKKLSGITLVTRNGTTQWQAQLTHKVRKRCAGDGAYVVLTRARDVSRIVD